MIHSDSDEWKFKKEPKFYTGNANEQKKFWIEIFNSKYKTLIIQIMNIINGKKSHNRLQC